MNRWIILAAVGLMLVVPVASAASTYPQTGYDAGRTGAIPFEGPQSNDTAFQIELPGTPVGQPVIGGDNAYMLTGDFGFGGLDARALWTIGLATGNVSQVMEIPDSTNPLFPNSLVQDELLLGWDDERFEVVALEIPSGEERWRVGAFDAPPEAHPGNGYDGSVRVGDRLYVGYSANLPVTGDVSGVMAVDLEGGERLWRWDRTQAIREDTEIEGQETPVPVPDPTGGPDRMPGSIQLTADGDRVYVYLFHSQPRQQGELWGLDAETGTSLWDRHDQERIGQGFGTEGWAVATPERIYIRLEAFQALNPATGATIWTSPAGRTDQIDMQGATNMGAREDAVIGTSPQSVYRMDPDTGDVRWQHTNTEGGTYGTGQGIVLDAETAYVPTSAFEGSTIGPAYEARGLDDGELLWEWSYVPSVGFGEGQNLRPGKPAFAEGALIWGAKDGTVTVVGETAASLGQPDVPDELYPGVGNETTIDASDTDPGAFGPATRYMVDWGDGTVSGWQEDPVFTHTYEEEGEHEAKVYAGNDANQTASTFVTMNVGEEAPTQPNMIETAFARENQDMTFGILGILVAVTGGAIGVTTRYRKRSRLQEELETLEAGFEDARQNPGECEAFLDTRKARARSLMMEGDLTEEQFGVIDARVTELRRELRTGLLDERLQFLPYGMVQSLKRMLGDGQISTWERETIEELLDQDKTLNEAQRERVRGMLERWSGPGAADPGEAGGGSA